MRADGAPMASTVASVIAFGSGTFAAQTSPNQRRNCSMGFARTCASSSSPREYSTRRRWASKRWSSGDGACGMSDECTEPSGLRRPALRVVRRQRAAELFPLLDDGFGLAGAVEHVELALDHLGDRLAGGAE